MRVGLSILMLKPRILLRVLMALESLQFVATGDDTRPGAVVTGVATEASVSSSGSDEEVNKASRKAPKALAGREDRYGALLPLLALTWAFNWRQAVFTGLATRKLSSHCSIAAALREFSRVARADAMLQ